MSFQNTSRKPRKKIPAALPSADLFSHLSETHQRKIALKPEYPPITPGSRNLSLTSLAGQMHNQGYSKAEIYKELLYANSVACQPPLDRSEVELIVNSVTRYRR